MAKKTTESLRRIKKGHDFENNRGVYTEGNIFFVAEEVLCIRFLLLQTPEIRILIEDAMRAIEKENIILNDVFPKNYVSPDLARRVLGKVFDLFTNEVKMDGTEMNKYFLGRTYEY